MIDSYRGDQHTVSMADNLCCVVAMVINHFLKPTFAPD